MTWSHLGLRREMHVCSRWMDVRSSWAGGCPLHRVVWWVGVTDNRRRMGSRRGWCRLCHDRRMPRRWSDSIAHFWTIALEIRVVATVFGRAVNGFDRRMRTRGLGRGSRKISGRGRGHHSIGVVYSGSRGRIRLYVSIRWIPVVVVHGVGVMWITPWSGRVVRVVRVGNKGSLTWCGRLRSRHDGS